LSIFVQAKYFHSSKSFIIVIFVKVKVLLALGVTQDDELFAQLKVLEVQSFTLAKVRTTFFALVTNFSFKQKSIRFVGGSLDFHQSEIEGLFSSYVFVL